MCGKYYLKKGTLHQMSQCIDEKDVFEEEGDLCPGKYIPVLLGQNQRILLTSMKWGYTFKNSSNLVIHARCESIFEKKMFKEDILYRRCLIPASGFYERDLHRREFKFEKCDHQHIFFAGIFREREKEVCMITTQANKVMKPIHSRMPLVIDMNNIKQWLFEAKYIESCLQSQNEDLQIVSGLFQQSLFDE